MNSLSSRNLSYNTGCERCTGDLFLPGEKTDLPSVLLIHGGGWNALNKEALNPVVPLFLQEGRAVFSINYRLLKHAPWPACGDDCAAAGRFLLEGGLERHGLPAAGRILICGASAGGHLAMIAGLRLGRGNVEAILSLAGPSRLYPAGTCLEAGLFSGDFLVQFFGCDPSAELLADASPVSLVTDEAPPLFCVHSRNDRLVAPSHSQEAAAAWRRAGVHSEMILFDGPDESHGFWVGEDFAARQPAPQFAASLREALSRLVPVG